MRVYIRQNGRTWPPIPCPLWLIKLGIRTCNSDLIRRYIPEDSKRYIDALDFAEIDKALRILKEYKGLKLVEVSSNDGNQVTITA